MNPVVFRDPTFAQNSYLFRYKTDAVVVDPGFNGEAIVAYLAEKGYALKMVLLTHGHYDHTRDLRVLQKTLVFPLCLHADDRVLMDDDAQNGATYFRGSFKLKSGQETRLFHDGDRVPFGPGEIRVIHTPGHTPGSSCFLYQDVLFSGDTVFRGDLGRTDLFGGSRRQLAESVRKLFAATSDDTPVLPGHEEATTIGAERKGNPEVAAILKNR